MGFIFWVTKLLKCFQCAHFFQFNLHVFQASKKVATISSFYLYIYLWGWILWPALYLACSAFCLCLASCPHSCPCVWHCLSSFTYIFSNCFSSYTMSGMLHSFLNIISLSDLCLQLLIISSGSWTLVCYLRSSSKHEFSSSLSLQMVS